MGAHQTCHCGGLSKRVADIDGEEAPQRVVEGSHSCVDPSSTEKDLQALAAVVSDVRNKMTLQEALEEKETALKRLTLKEEELQKLQTLLVDTQCTLEQTEADLAIVRAEQSTSRRRASSNSKGGQDAAEAKQKSRSSKAATKSAPQGDARTNSVPTSAQGRFKVCVCGGAGSIGQPLSLLLALNELVGEVSLYDLAKATTPTKGVAADLAHVKKAAKVKAYTLGENETLVDHHKECFSDCSLVLVPAGVPRKSGMKATEFLEINAAIAKSIVEACAAYCPDAVIGLILNPVNSLVPAMAELYRKKGLDAKKIIGVTTLNGARAAVFVHESTGCPPSDFVVPVVGGHTGSTILPLFSQCSAAKDIQDISVLERRVQDGNSEVVIAKNGSGSATLSMAYSANGFANAVLRGLAGLESGTHELGYVNCSITELPYFSSTLRFGPTGVEAVQPLGALNAYEKKRLKSVIKELRKDIEVGMNYAKENVLMEPAFERPDLGS